MLDLNSKISSFKKIVWQTEKKKSESELYSSTNYSSDVLEKKKRDLVYKLESYIKKRESFANSRKNQMIAQKIEDEKDIYYQYKNELLDEIIEKLKEDLTAYTKTDEYKKNFKKDATDKLKELNQNDDLVLYVKDSDKDLFDFDVKTLNDDVIGGFIIKDKKETFQYNFTLIKKLEDERYNIGKKLYQVLEKEVKI